MPQCFSLFCDQYKSYSAKSQHKFVLTFCGIGFILIHVGRENAATPNGVSSHSPQTLKPREPMKQSTPALIFLTILWAIAQIALGCVYCLVQAVKVFTASPRSTVTAESIAPIFLELEQDDSLSQPRKVKTVGHKRKATLASMIATEAA
jgi:hypothetical protein